MTPPSDPRVIGRRFGEARKKKGITQEQAAQHLSCSRPTLIAIEKGERAASPEEIASLSGFYGVSVHEIVRPRQDAVQFRPHLRAAAEGLRVDSSEMEDAIGEFQRLAQNYHELEEITKAPLQRNYPAIVDLKSGIDPRVLAEDIADRERRRLGIGDEPSMHLRSILEEKVGLRIFYYPLPSSLAGMYAYDEVVGGCILVNLKHPPDRRRASLVHEYGHLIVDRFRPGVDLLEYKGRKPRNERFTESFSMAFLMPVRDVRQRFCDIVNRTGDFQVADLCWMANYYAVSVEALAFRLEDLELIPGGAIAYLKDECAFKVREAQELLGLRPGSESEGMLPGRYRLLAARAFRQGKISEGQLASFLRCDRVAAREAISRLEEGESWDSPEGKRASRSVDIEKSLLK